jgi:hypothetical protein
VKGTRFQDWRLALIEAGLHQTHSKSHRAEISLGMALRAKPMLKA